MAVTYLPVILVSCARIFESSALGMQDQGSYSITALLTKMGCVAVGISYIEANLRWKCFSVLRLWLMVGCKKWQVVTCVVSRVRCYRSGTPVVTERLVPEGCWFRLVLDT